MIKRMTLLARKEELSFAQFDAHWLNNHARIVERMPDVAGYVQNPVKRRVAINGIESAPFDFDGIVELWFADERAKARAFSSVAAQSLPVDEQNFIRGITIFAIEEKIIKPKTADIKTMLLCRMGNCGLTASDMALQLANMTGVRHLGANHVLEVNWRSHLWYEPMPPDLLVELKFDDEADASQFAGSLELSSLVRQIQPGGGTLGMWLVTERRII